MSGNEFIVWILGIVLFFVAINKIKNFNDARKNNAEEAKKIRDNNLFKYEHLDRMLEYAANTEYTMMLKDAERGDASSQLFIGEFFYCNGFYGQAMKWYKRAAKSNCHKSQCRLGEMYCKGMGMKTNDKNEKKGRVWLEKSICNGNTRASGILDERVMLDCKKHLESVWS